MILDCPACGARYRLPDDAIPAAGKTVRCARCKHSWVELGEPFEDGPAETRPSYAAALDAMFAEPSNASPTVTAGSAEPSNTRDVISPVSQPPVGVVDAAVYDPEPELPAPRRGRWLWLAPLLLLIALALGAAAVLTRVVEVPAFVSARIDVPRLARPALTLPALDLPPLDLTRIPYAGPWLDRRLNPPALPPVPLTLQATAEFHQLGNGSRMLALTGSVANPTGSQQAVPEIEALLLDAARHHRHAALRSRP